MTNYTFIIYCCYLPPDKSELGSCTNFFEHVITRFYMHSYADCVYVCGDFNVCTGSRIDVAGENNDAALKISSNKD